MMFVFGMLLRLSLMKRFCCLQGRAVVVLVVMTAAAALAGCGSTAAATSRPDAKAAAPAACSHKASASLPAEGWSAARRQLAPRGVGAIRLCRYSGLNAHPRLTLVGSALLTRPGLVGQLVSEFDRLPSLHGAVACPADDGSQILARLAYPGDRDLLISVGLTGCETVTNGSVHRTAAGMGSPTAFGPQLVTQLERLAGRRSSGVTRSIVCDQAVAYRSFTALRRAASSVAMLVPTTSTRRTSTGGVAFTITRVRVQETLAGKRLAHTILLRQTGAPGMTLTGCGQLVSSGHRYLAYLTPFKLHQGGPQVGDQYSVVGASQGLFELRHPTSPAS